MNKNDVYEVIMYGKEIYERINQSKRVFLYGAGSMGREVFSVLKQDKEYVSKVDSFLVTEMGRDSQNIVDGVKVRTVDLVEYTEGDFILITIENDAKYEVERLLAKKGFVNSIMIDRYRFREYAGLRRLGEDRLLWLQEELPTDKYKITEEIYEKTLNIGKFISSLQTKQLSFPALSLNWGGSMIIDYALLRGLALKYGLNSYLEIGTYIGDSVSAVSDVIEKCYSISVPKTHPAHMRNWCKQRHLNDYSGKLLGEKVVCIEADSKFFDWDHFEEKIDLYFIDGDHSYLGVLLDSIHVVDKLDLENSFIVWHDCRNASGVDEETVGAIKAALGARFENFYVFDYSMCGIYIPDKYKNDFVKASVEDKLQTYKITLEVL